MRLRAAIRSHLDPSRGDPVHGLLRQCYRRFRMLRNRYRFDDRTPQAVFTKIYAKGLWGRDGSDDPFYSGAGSHDEAVVRPYVDAARKFLQRLGHPDVVDVGCGDFAIGSQLRHYCKEYVAADIVEPLIVRNRTKYHDLNVDFRVLNLASDDPPAGDVVFVRQVFQHMSNADIARSLAHMAEKYRYLIVTEHLPADPGFPHNLDKGSGADIRLYVKEPSGIVLTSAPFNLPVRNAEVLCDVALFDGPYRSVLTTTAYEL